MTVVRPRFPIIPNPFGSRSGRSRFFEATSNCRRWGIAPRNPQPPPSYSLRQIPHLQQSSKIAGDRRFLSLTSFSAYSAGAGQHVFHLPRRNSRGFPDLAVGFAFPLVRERIWGIRLLVVSRGSVRRARIVTVTGADLLFSGSDLPAACQFTVFRGSLCLRGSRFWGFAGCAKTPVLAGVLVFLAIPGAEGVGFEPTVRTGPPPVFKTGGDGPEPLHFQAITLSNPAGSSTGSSNPGSPTFHTDLARVVELWPSLPQAIRTAVLALVNASAPVERRGERMDSDQLPPGYERMGGSPPPSAPAS